MPRSPLVRMLVTLMCLDAVFTAMIGYTFFATMGLESESARPVITVISGLWIVKVIAWVAIISTKLQPLQRWFPGRDARADPDTIRGVAITMYRAPFMVSAVWAVMFGGTCMLNTVVLYFACADSVPLGPRALEAQLFSNLGVLLGAAELAFPLTEWLLAPMIEHLRRHAEMAGRDPASIDVAFTTGEPGPGDAGYDAGAHLAALARMTDLGVTWNGVGMPGDSVEHAVECLQQYGSEVIDRYGA
jgi:hypothetical protein